MSSKFRFPEAGIPVYREMKKDQKINLYYKVFEWMMMRQTSE